MKTLSLHRPDDWGSTHVWNFNETTRHHIPEQVEQRSELLTGRAISLMMAAVNSSENLANFCYTSSSMALRPVSGPWPPQPSSSNPTFPRHKLRFPNKSKFYRVGLSNPRPTPTTNQEDQRTIFCLGHHLWPVRHGSPCHYLCYRRRSSQDPRPRKPRHYVKVGMPSAGSATIQGAIFQKDVVYIYKRIVPIVIIKELHTSEIKPNTGNTNFVMRRPITVTRSQSDNAEKYPLKTFSETRHKFCVRNRPRK
jgi:hypothetical protein